MDDKAAGRILKLLIYCSVGQVALVAITATTLGVFVRDHTKEIDSLKSHQELLKTDTAQLRTEQEALNGSPHNLGQNDQGFQMATNQSQVREFIERIGTLESDMETNTAAIQANSERLTRIESTIAADLSAVTNTSDGGGLSNGTFVAFDTFDDATRSIQVKIYEQDHKINELSQNCSSRFRSLETDMIANQNVIDELTNDVSELKDTVSQRVSVDMQHNNSLTISSQTLGSLEVDIDLHESKLAELDAIFVMALPNIDSELQKIKSDQLNNKDIITNNTLNILQLQAVSERHSSSADLDSRLIKLESDMNTTHDAIEDISFKIRKLEANMTTELAYSNNQSIRISELEANLIMVEDIAKDYNDTAARLKTLEDNRLADQTMDTQQEGRIVALENNMDANERILQNHTSVLDEMKNVLNCAWDNWSEFSSCTHTCEGGIKYRTRQCQNTSPVRDDWLPKTDIDIRSCNTQTCPDHRSAFTYMMPKDAPKARRITFSLPIVNIGDNFDTSTGLFTCVHPGIYVFILHMYKTVSASFASCYMVKNNEILVVADINPDSHSDGEKLKQQRCYFAPKTMDNTLNNGDGKGITIRRSRCTVLEPEDRR